MLDHVKRASIVDTAGHMLSLDLFLQSIRGLFSNRRMLDLSRVLQVIMATNRADTLDPALLRPGRLDRKIEFPVPDRRQKRLVFQACTGKMNLSEVGVIHEVHRIHSLVESFI